MQATSGVQVSRKSMSTSDRLRRRHMRRGQEEISMGETEFPSEVGDLGRAMSAVELSHYACLDAAVMNIASNLTGRGAGDPITIGSSTLSL